MKELSMKEIKDVELNLLFKIDKICKENNIKYFLGFGSLLGAVRHQGFIPWDDDIDILLERKDFNMLCDIFSEQTAGGQAKIIPISNCFQIVYIRMFHIHMQRFVIQEPYACLMG